MQDAYVHCESLVREADKDRFLADLFVSAELRPHLFALHAFNVEIARVRDLAREPLPGEIRLQWWYDALSGQGHGDVAAHPVAGALIATIERFALPRQALIDFVEARSFDLYDDPMATVDDLERYAQRTSSTLFSLGARILGQDEDPVVTRAAECGGVAYAIAGLLRAFPDHAARRQLFVPGDLLDRHGVNRDEIFAGRTGPALTAALAELRAHAGARLGECNELVTGRPWAAVFLPLALVRPLLRRLERSDDPFAPVEVPQWRRQWALWRAARRLRA